MNESPYLSQYLFAFFNDHLICRQNLSATTIKSYRDAIKLFITFVGIRLKKPAAELCLTDMTEETVMAFLQHLEKERGNTIQTRNHRLVVLRRLFDYITRREPVGAEPCRVIRNIPLKRNRERPEIHYLEKEEFTALMNAIDTGSAIGRRDYTLLLFMYNTGARVSEAAHLVPQWLSLQPPYKVEILGKGRKWRTCPLWKNTAMALRKLLDERPDAMPQDHPVFVNRFGRPLSRFGIRNLIEKYKNKAAVTMPQLNAKPVSPHTLRHTTAMHLLQSGVEINVIRSWLGHVKLETTHRYAEIDMAMKAKALKACELTDTKNSPRRWRSNPDVLAWLETL